MSQFDPPSRPRDDRGGDAPVDEFDVDTVDTDVEASFDTDVETPSIDAPPTATLSLEQIGGIDEGEVTIDAGITTIAGHNATNRTSTLRGLCAALGTEATAAPATTLSSDADVGRVELDFGEETYTRTFTRTDRGSVVAGGDPLADDGDVVDAFVTLLEDNPVRRAVERGGDPTELRDLLMRPVDTEAVDRRIDDLESQLQQIDEYLATIDGEEERLPTLRDQREQKQKLLEEIETEIGDVEAEVDAYDASEAEAEQAEELLEQLQDLRSELAETKDEAKYHRKKAAEYEEEATEVEATLEATAVPEEEIERIDEKLARQRRRKRDRQATYTDVDAIIGFNETVLEDDDIDINAIGGNRANESEAPPGSDSVTDQLNPADETVECWTCGSDVAVDAVRDQLDTLRDLRADLHADVGEIEDEIDELQDRLQELDDEREEYRRLESRSERIEDQIDHHRSEAERRTESAQELAAEIEELERRVDETEALRESDLVEAYQRLSELEYERGQAESELEGVETEIERIQQLVDDREDVEEARDAVVEGLHTLRGRVEAAERALASAFNEHMERVVEVLDYENIARIWIDHKPGDAVAEPGTFELTVVREGDDGAVYEDSVRTLSESERKVLGLVLALSGYIVHRVYDDVPFVVLDSVEAIDAERIAELLGYFGQRTGFLITALLPEDAAVVESSEQTVARGPTEYYHRKAEDIGFLSE
ncbi:archaea-specific SMC-related protein [Salinarchaeum laminariae]|uniref:archaea-specific SMC-related protein n=1 Tax=Salinarchaeum laminariae TaxID=869888 RepID=UPI0020BEA834|nr:archaea-specific SMC-related protein [Salinarchaeum laminariae]